MTVSLIHADSRHALRDIPDFSIDACVTDPPYALASVTKRFGAENAAPAKGNGAYMRASRGFMGQQWDNGSTAFDPDFWREVLRVLKPGAHLLAFGGTRTYHRMACAIEDADFEIRDQLQWLYGSGFPKSHDVSKAIDRAAGADREIIGPKHDAAKRTSGGKHEGWQRPWQNDPDAVARNQNVTAPSTDAAKQWNGWGTALKPASEPICLARKPLSEKTIAANVLRWGTGALNIDGCRIPYAGMKDAAAVGYSESMKRGSITRETSLPTTYDKPRFDPHANGGRWPANLCHDGSAEVLAAFPDSDGQQGDVRGTEPSECHNGIYSGPRKRDGIEYPSRNDSGSAARFFYCAKATTADRDDGLLDLQLRRHVAFQTGNGASGKPSSISEGRNTERRNTHPTVKPTALMQWLVRLVTPPGGIVLDPFMGTGSTGRGCVMEGFDFVGIEREAPYVELARLRIAAAEKKAPPPTLADLFAEAGEAGEAA